MKKLLALLLVFLLPLCAMAETYGLSIDVKTEDAFLAFVKDALLEQADANAAENSAALVQKLVDGLGMDMSFQEAAFSMAIRLAGKPLLDMTGYEFADQMLITTSMLPGYALSTPVEESDTTEFDQVDWVGIGLNVVSTLDSWTAGLEKAESRGIFVGDAYEGGTKCTTWVLDDQDLSALMNSLLNEDLRAALTFLYTAAELNAADILANFDELNANVASENRYAYMLRVVQDEIDQLVGLSLTVTQDGEQAATASMGFLPGGIKVVVGLGLDQQNYWCDVTTNSVIQDDKLSMSVTTREWSASKEDAFAYVQGVTAPANTCIARLDIASADHGYVWDGAVTANGDVLLTANGTCVPEAVSMNGVVCLGAEENALLSISFVFGKAEEIPALDESLTVCSLTDPKDAELSEKLGTQLASALLVRMMKLLPVEQILQMNPFTLP